MCVVGALVLGSYVYHARASTIGDSNLNRASIVDCLNSLGKSSKWEDRRLLAEADTHAVMRKSLPYRKLNNDSQNKHLLADNCPEWANSYGYSSGSGHPKVSEAERRVIIATLREKARIHGIDEVKFINTARCESHFYSRAVGDQGRSRGMWQYLKGKNGHRGKMSDSIAFNWRMASDSAAVDFATEGWVDEYKYHLRWDSRSMSLKKVWFKTGRKIWDSTALRWTCYRNLYGRTSARVTPKPDTPAWAISPSSRSLALMNSD